MPRAKKKRQRMLRVTEKGDRLMEKHFRGLPDGGPRGRVQFWVEDQLQLMGWSRTNWLCWKICVVASTKETPVGWLCWAVKEPIARWLGDNDYDRLMRRPTEFHGDPGVRHISEDLK